MADQQLTLAMRLYADATRFIHAMGKSGGAVHTFARGVRSEMGSIRRALGTVQGQFAALGVTVGATAVAVQSARLDKSIVQIAITAGKGQKEAIGLRKELFALSKETGRPVEELQQGFNNLIQAGLSWEQSLETIHATNKAMAVTSAQADVLTSGLTVAAAAFDFDLSQPGKALELLDKMTLAGFRGNAELENLSSIFSRVAVNAKSANFSFDDTLAFIEGLSAIEKNPERLATLADSTVRLFTNLRYLRSAQKATGVQFFDEQTGARRNPIAVLRDLRVEFQKLTTDAQRAQFVSRAFGQADLDTQRGLRALLSGAQLDNISSIGKELITASGLLEANLDTALKNAVDQAGRLKTTLREAADGFAQPVLDAFTGATKFLLDKDKANLSGGQLLAGGGGIAALTYLAARVGGKRLGKLFGIGGGVAAGKALEAAAGVTPVYVVGAAPGVFSGSGGAIGDILAGGLPGRAGSVARRIPKTFGGFRAGAGLFGSARLGTIATMGAGAIGTSGALVVGAGAIGGLIGTLIYDAIDDTSVGDAIGRGITNVLAAFGNDEAQQALADSGDDNAVLQALRFVLNPGGTLAESAKQQLEGNIKIEIDDKGRARVRELQSDTPGVDIDVSTGPTMAFY